MKKRFYSVVVSMLIASSSMVAVAACPPHVVTNKESDWHFVSVAGVRAGDSHRYAKVIAEDGTVLEYGICKDTIYTDRQAQSCTICHTNVLFRTVERTVHDPQ